MGGIALQGVGKRYAGLELSLRGTKLEMQGPALWARNLARAARLTAEAAAGVQALSDIWLHAAPGEVLGLIGHNGSGKTTLIKILAGLLAPSAGTGSVAGVPLGQRRALRAAVSYVATNGWMALEWPLTAQENVCAYGVWCGLDGSTARRRAAEALRAVQLWPDRDKYPSQLSNGMRQRVILARALLQVTPVVLLDEPTVGLDPQTASVVLELIGQLRSRGQTVVLADHVTAELEATADRVAVLAGGRLVLQGTPAELLGPLRHLVVLDVHTEEAAPPADPPPPAVRLAHCVERPGPVPTRAWRIHAVRGAGVLDAVLDWITAAAGPGARVVLLRESEPTLEDAVRLHLEPSAAEAREA